MKRIASRVVLLSALCAGLALAQEAPQSQGPEAAAERLGLQVARDAPIDITADELEFLRGATGGERIIFRDGVKVVQGSLRMDADWVEAMYPKGAGGGRPRRITAKGNVYIRQGDAEVRCNEARFDGQCKVACSTDDGSATLQREGDVVRGRNIDFDLCSGLLKVRGRARVRIQGRPTKAEPTNDPAPVSSPSDVPSEVQKEIEPEKEAGE